jgi:hypothetical protein
MMCWYVEYTYCAVVVVVVVVVVMALRASDDEVLHEPDVPLCCLLSYRVSVKSHNKKRRRMVGRQPRNTSLKG